jgi:hypothetical protein
LSHAVFDAIGESTADRVRAADVKLTVTGGGKRRDTRPGGGLASVNGEFLLRTAYVRR